MIKPVEANPYVYPYNCDLRPENTALLVIDMQVDFCGLGGYLDKKGYVGVNLGRGQDHLVIYLPSLGACQLLSPEIFPPESIR